MQSQPVPEYPWQLVSQDLCQFEDETYLITVDHFSDFIGVDELDNTLSVTVIAKSKAHFSRHGIPEVLLTDNGPQFVSVDFASFCELYGITHVTSSPYWPRGNGKAESAVKVVKSLMKKSTDMYLALLHYRNTPQQGHTFSPAQRSLGRRTRSTLPVAKQLLNPEGSASELVQAQITAKRQQAKKHYDMQARNDHAEIDIGDFVYTKPAPQNKSKPWQYGKVVTKSGPRSYRVETPTGSIR
jgi:transposase InsO family protein